MEVEAIELSEGNLRDSIQVCVKTLSEGCIILVDLLSMLALPITQNQTQAWKHETANRDYSWILSCLARLWNALLLKYCDLAENKLDLCVTTLLETLIGMLRHVAEFRYDPFLATKIMALLSHLICAVISPGSGPVTAALEGSISSALLELAQISAHSRPILAGFRENLLLILKDTKEHHRHWDTFTVDLQVCPRWSADVR